MASRGRPPPPPPPVSPSARRGTIVRGGGGRLRPLPTATATRPLPASDTVVVDVDRRGRTTAAAAAAGARRKNRQREAEDEDAEDEDEDDENLDRRDDEQIRSHRRQRRQSPSPPTPTEWEQFVDMLGEQYRALEDGQRESRLQLQIVVNTLELLLGKGATDRHSVQVERLLRSSFAAVPAMAPDVVLLPAPNDSARRDSADSGLRASRSALKGDTPMTDSITAESPASPAAYLDLRGEALSGGNSGGGGAVRNVGGGSAAASSDWRMSADTS